MRKSKGVGQITGGIMDGAKRVVPEPLLFSHPCGHVKVTPIQDQRFCVTVLPSDPTQFVERHTCETSWPLELIKVLIEKEDLGWLCEVIARHEDPGYVGGVIKRQLFAYFQPSEFAGKRMLDFGCGSGASTFALAKFFPDAEVVGIELDENNIEIAQAVQSVRALPNVRFLKSPHGSSLPSNLGQFDFVILSAVYEHLLPAERKTLMPLIWNLMKPEATIFINQTPHRYFPLEAHSTRLWLINYLPDRLTCLMATKWSRYNQAENRRRNWEAHLRGGIRGGTERRILRDLEHLGGKGRILEPTQGGLRDRADYWLAGTNPDRHRTAKRLLGGLFRVTNRYLGMIPASHVDVAIQKKK